MRAWFGARFLLGALGILSLTGCGGGSEQRPVAATSRGAVQIIVRWPEASRLIPTAARSIRVEFSTGQSLLLARPGTSATVNDLPAGTVLTITATAYPNPDGSGVAQATGTAAVTVVADQIAPVTLTMSSAIDRLEIAPIPPALASGQSASLTATARDAAGNAVLVGAGNIVWGSSDTGVAGVDASGTMTGVSAGGATITAVETESGRSASITVRVVVSVSISPASATLTLRQTQLFTATVAGSPNQGVTWSVEPGGAGGTINAQGVYTAPVTPGTDRVVATSQADPNQRATATVTVQAGSGTVIVD